MLFKRIYWIIPVLLGFAIYFPIIQFGFVWDDHQFFEDSNFFKTASIRELFLTRIPLWENDIFYRPLTQTLFFVQYKIGGGQPSFFHAVSLVFFLTNCLLVMGISYKALIHKNEKNALSGAHFFVFLAGILYVVHPAMVEVVSWVSSQFDLQMTFWLLLLFLVSMFSKHYISGVIASSVLYFCACSSKEMSVFFPLVFLMLHYFLETSSSDAAVNKMEFLKSKQSDIIGMMVGGAIYLAFRMYCTPGNPMNIFRVSFSELYLEAARSLFWYAKLSLVPFYGIGMHFKDAEEYSALWYAVGGSILLLITLISVWAYTAFGLMGGCFIVALAPALLTVTSGYSATFISERYLSYPLAFLIIQLAIFAGTFRNRNNLTRNFSLILRAISLALIAYLGVFSSHLVAGWKSDLGVWLQTLQVNPGSQYARSQVASSYAQAGLCEKAEEVARQTNANTTITVVISIARCRIEKNPQFAIDQMQALLAMPGKIGDHDFYNALTTLAIANANLGNYDKAIEIYRDILEAYPARYKLHMSMSEVFLRACKKEEAQREFKKAMGFVPDAAKAEWNRVHEISSNKHDESCRSNKVILK